MTKVGSARIGENGTINGRAGDQTGGEVSEQNFYTHSLGWDVIRPISVAFANAIGNKMKQACNNNNIGYSQRDRYGIIRNGINSTVRTNGDCSSTVRACVKEATGVDAGDFTTGNEKRMLMNTGLFTTFHFISETETPLYVGDILVTRRKGHTVIVTQGNIRELNSDYFPRYYGGNAGIDEVFATIGATKYYDNNAKYKWQKRKPIAVANGYPNYTGTATENSNLCKLAKNGELLKPRGNTCEESDIYFPRYTGNASGIDEVFSSIGATKYYNRNATYNWQKRKPIAVANGYTNYCGSGLQNTNLCKLAREGKLLKPRG